VLEQGYPNGTLTTGSNHDPCNHYFQETLDVLLKLLLDPKIFNYIIMTLYVLNSLRWAYARSWGDALYWIAAFQITAAVTWGFQR